MIYFKIFTFHGSKSAKIALGNMEIHKSVGLVTKEEEAAVISVDDNGEYNVEGSWNKDDNQLSMGIKYFTPLSRLIGILFGPHGDFAQVNRDDSIQKLVGNITNIEFTDPVLKDVKASVKPDQSMLVILGDRSFIDMFTEELSGYKVNSFEVTLNDATEAALEANL